MAWPHIFGTLTAGNQPASYFDDNFNAISFPTGSSLVGFVQAGTGATTRTAQAKLRDVVNVLDYGAVGDGATDNTTAFANAIAELAALGGGILQIPAGAFSFNGVAGADGKLNGVLIPYTTATNTRGRIIICGAGRATVLLAGSANMYVVRLSDSLCGISDLTINGHGFAGVTGLGIVPEDTTQLTTVVNQNHNNIRNVDITSCTEGLELMAGPTVLTVDSGCWYNRFYSLKTYTCTRGIWLRNGAAVASSNNRNSWFGGSISNGNTGIQIDNGNTNNFYSVSFEGISTGATPNTTPTAFFITTSGTGGSCESNRFFGSNFEGCTRDIRNDSNRTELYGCNYDGAKILFNANPLISIGGYDASMTPQILEGMVYQMNSQLSGYGNTLSFTNGAYSSLGFKAQRQTAPVVSTSGAASDFGGFTLVSGAGGGAIVQGFQLPFSTAGIGQSYLAVSQGIDSSDSSKNAYRASLFVEIASNSFVEYNLVDVKNTITTSTISLSRSGTVVTMTATISGGIGADTVGLACNLVRFS